MPLASGSLSRGLVHVRLLAADASGAEGAGVGADLLEGADECLYVGVGEVACEVSFPSRWWRRARTMVSRPLLVRLTRIERRSLSGRTRRSRPASSIRSTTRVKPLLL